MYTLEGVSSISKFITAYEQSQYNRYSYFIICYIVFPMAIFLPFIVTMKDAFYFPGELPRVQSKMHSVNVQ